MKKSNFFFAYWPVVLISSLMVFPRLFIQPPDWSEHVVHFMGRIVLEEIPLLLSAIVLLSGLTYWFLEYLGYRFNFIVKTVHLVFTWPFLIIGAAQSYIVNYEARAQTNDGSFSTVTPLFGHSAYDTLREMMPVAFVMLLCAQAIGIPYILIVLVKGRGKTVASALNILDSEH